MLKFDSIGKSIKRYSKELLVYLRHMVIWFFLAAAIGLVVGSVSITFAYLDGRANAFRTSNPWVLFCLPLIGIIITLIYQIGGVSAERGTNLVISTLQAKSHLPHRMAPIIFVSTILTHLGGGSVGREGAALQLGGSIGSSISRIPFIKYLRDDPGNRRIAVMCGMSAAFSAIFGTPMAATIFSMEVVSIGIMHYSALFPCVIAANEAHRFAFFLGFDEETFYIASLPDLTAELFMHILILSCACGILSSGFCVLLSKTHKLFGLLFKNPYLRALIGGLIFIGVILVFNRDYMGAGMNLIESAVKGQERPYDFILKMGLTALCIGCGYKGGEIVPSLSIGALFGALYAKIAGVSHLSALFSEIGMTAMFCGVTNCPVTSILIASELFSFRGTQYLLIAVAASYVISGYYSLYADQNIVYSKFHNKYVNHRANYHPDL